MGIVHLRIVQLSNNVVFVILHLLLLLSSAVVSGAGLFTSEWSYEDQNYWVHDHHACSGMSQSPINIDKRSTAINASLHIEFHGYHNLILGFNVVNNGHSVQFNYIGDDRSAPMISGSALNYENYSLAQFHFHWAQQRGYGSEHTVNERAYSMELHLVHFNRARYYNLNEALQAKSNGVAVLAVFFQIERQNNIRLDEVVRLVYQVAERDVSGSVNPQNPIVLDGLLPDPYHRRRFYRYQGSLTTPPCTEGITWLVMHDSNLIGLDQINQLRRVRNVHKKELIGENYRHLQNLRGRIVEASFDSHRDSVASHTLSWAGLSVALMVSVVVGSGRL